MKSKIKVWSLSYFWIKVNNSVVLWDYKLRNIESNANILSIQIILFLYFTVLINHAVIQIIFLIKQYLKLIFSILIHSHSCVSNFNFKKRLNETIGDRNCYWAVACFVYSIYNQIIGNLLQSFLVSYNFQWNRIL